MYSNNDQFTLGMNSQQLEASGKGAEELFTAPG